jgi:hypothetical protein
MTLVGRIFSERRGVMVPLLILLVGNIGVLLALVWPMHRAVKGADNARMEAALALGVARKGENEAKMQRGSKERADIELKQFYTQVLPKDFRSAVGLANFWLGKVADDSKLRFRGGNFDSLPVKDSVLTRVTGQVSLLGDYANIRQFLYDVETAQEFVIIESVEMSPANATQGDTQLELTLSIATYYLTDRTAVAVTK